MKKLSLSTLFVICSLLTLSAQDIIYTSNGNRLENAQLTELTEDRVSFTVKQDKVKTYSFQRQNVLIAFSRTGNFLVIEDLSSDLAQAKQQLQAYLSAPPRSNDKDYLVKAIPLTVIPALISYESDDVVNYKTIDGKSASIPKSELVAIIYRNGNHKLLREVSEVAPLLKDVAKQINEGIPTANVQPAVVSVSPEPQKISTQQDNSAADLQIKSSPSTIEPQKTPTPTPIEAPAPTVVESGKPGLDAADYQLYRKKSLQKVDEFVSYLNIITDKKLPTYEKDKAIEQAAGLFMPAATIEVTSKSRPGARRFPIRDYLTRLKLLPYSSVKIEWSQVQYIKELSQAADGNYYGVITGQQTFMGYGANNDDVIYSDVTQKNVRVKLVPIPGILNNIRTLKWDVLLGSIGVAAQ